MNSGVGADRRALAGRFSTGTATSRPQRSICRASSPRNKSQLCGLIAPHGHDDLLAPLENLRATVGGELQAAQRLRPGQHVRRRFATERTARRRSRPGSSGRCCRRTPGGQRRLRPLPFGCDHSHGQIGRARLQRVMVSRGRGRARPSAGNRCLSSSANTVICSSHVSGGSAENERKSQVGFSSGTALSHDHPIPRCMRCP